MEGCEHLLELIIKSVFLVVAENQLQANTLSILSIIFNGKENINFNIRQIFPQVFFLNIVFRKKSH